MHANGRLALSLIHALRFSLRREIVSFRSGVHGVFVRRLAMVAIWKDRETSLALRHMGEKRVHRRCVCLHHATQKLHAVRTQQQIVIGMPGGNGKHVVQMGSKSPRGTTESQCIMVRLVLVPAPRCRLAAYARTPLIHVVGVNGKTGALVLRHVEQAAHASGCGI